MAESSSFSGLGIAPNILAVLDKLQYKVPTPIQEKSIPPGLEGKDVMGLAQTGTGKTLAFGIPTIQAALSGKHALIILPTRELALQVQEALAKIGQTLGIRTALLVGGESNYRQVQALHRLPQIVIGTPGRIIDHLQQKTLNLSKTTVLVLDEADRMLDMGFAPQLKRIFITVPKERQTMLYSATMPQSILAIAHSYMKLPLRIEIAPPGTAIEKITQELFFVSRNDKSRLLEKLLYEYRGSVLVFSRTKHGAKKIATSVRALGHTAAELHSNRSLGQRREALDGFRNGKYRILVATDIAARGIDVKGLELVINYDLPDNAEDYVHRIGRTGRAGASGHAISFATPDQRGDVHGIERLIRSTLPLSKLPELPPSRETASSYSDRPERGAHPTYGSRPAFGGSKSYGGARSFSTPGTGPSPRFNTARPRAQSTSTPGSRPPSSSPFARPASKPGGFRPFRKPGAPSSHPSHRPSSRPGGRPSYRSK
jgi:ATP-dependent RNA helicase RhlE